MAENSPMKQQPPTFLVSGTSFMGDTFSVGMGGSGRGSGGNESVGGTGAAGEALLAPPTFTSCCVAPFLTVRATRAELKSKTTVLS